MTRRIRTLLTVAYVGLAVVPLILVGAILALVGFKNLTDRSHEVQREMARRIATEVQAVIEYQIQGLAQLDVMNDLLAFDHDARQRKLARYLGNNPLINELSLLDAQGYELTRASLRQVTVPADYRDASQVPVVRAVRSTRRIHAGEVRIDEATGEPFLPIALPVIDRDDNRMSGILMAELRFRPVWDLLGRVDRASGETFFLLDGRRRVVAHPNPSVVLRDTVVNLPMDDGLARWDGDWIMLARDERRIAHQPFVVVVERSAYQALRPALLNIVVAGFLLVGSLLAVSVLLAMAERRILNPLQDLIDAARDVQQGDLTRTVPTPHDDEIGDLGRAFNRMTGRLRGLIDELREEIVHRQMAESAATENQMRLQDILDQAPAVIYLKDAKGRFTLVNRRHLRLLDKTVEQVIGKTDHDLFPAETADSFVANDRLVWTSGLAATWEETLVRPDGPHTYLSLKFPIRNMIGEIVALCGMSTDITERKGVERRLQQSEADIRSILDNMSDTFFRTDREGRVLMISRSLETLLGYRPDEVIGRRLVEVCVPPAEEQRFREHLRGLDDVSAFQARLRHKNGDEVWVSVNAHFHRDGADRIAGIEGTARNITRQLRDEAALRASEERFRDVTESLSDWIWETDAQYRFVFLSPRFGELANVSAGDLLGRRLWEVAVPDSEYGTACDDLRHLFESRHAFRGIVCRYLDASGTAHFWRLSGNPTADADGRARGYRGAASDVTRTRQTDLQLRKLSSAIEQSPVSVIITDTQGSIEYVNPAFCRVTGYRTAEVFGRNPRFLKSGYNSAAEYANLWKTITGGGEWRGELQNRRKDGSLFWEFASISPLKDEQGRITHFMAIKEDISGLKAVEASLLKAKEQAEAANRIKTNFLANMSHELRTPLNGIIGFAEMLSGNYFGPLTDKQREYVDDIHDSGQHLLDVIGTILDLSRIETGYLDLIDEELKVNEVIDRCIAMVRGEAAQAGIVLVCTVPRDCPRLRADNRAVRQVLLNLLSNAIKHTGAGGRIMVGARMTAEGDMILDVVDSGTGIPAEMLDRIFEPFQQGDSGLSRRQGGVGLGLTITRGLMAALGGTLTLTSTVGVGTTATARFPADRIV